ncbi:hypothetical protein TNCV_3146481 [Trichonephila clavipes]|nr:hypothetical protein TNCV_3146481 [Trichonephila clavipes]
MLLRRDNGDRITYEPRATAPNFDFHEVYTSEISPNISKTNDGMKCEQFNSHEVVEQYEMKPKITVNDLQNSEIMLPSKKQPPQVSSIHRVNVSSTIHNISVFIMHAMQDEAYAKKLASFLTKNNIQVIISAGIQSMLYMNHTKWMRGIYEKFPGDSINNEILFVKDLIANEQLEKSRTQCMKLTGQTKQGRKMGVLKVLATMVLLGIHCLKEGPGTLIIPTCYIQRRLKCGPYLWPEMVELRKRRGPVGPYLKTSLQHTFSSIPPAMPPIITRRLPGWRLYSQSPSRHSDESDVEKLLLPPDASELTGEDEGDENKVSTRHFSTFSDVKRRVRGHKDKIIVKIPNLINSYNKHIDGGNHHDWLAGLYSIKIVGKSGTGHFYIFTGYGYSKRLDNSQNSQQR